MRNQKLIKSAIFLLGLSLEGAYAQQAITASGGNATGSGGSANYSIGQVFNSIHTGISGSVTQGVQQPFEIFDVTGIKNTKEINLNYSAYPNPVTDFLILKIDGDNNSQFIATLYNIQGKLLETQKIEGSETIISMKNRAPAVYFLKVTQTQHNATQQEVKSFKIIKK